ncbi:MAG TPA: glycosyltransferase family 87 protein [Candidatus Limnocylindrales bacterium]|nr:glycosyltransferase family 87 protein [Candidatus Limnocylindrales bacterium]
MEAGLDARRRNYVLARIIALALAFGVLAAIQAVYFQRGFIPGDSFTYLAAGERLNDGHSLYALSAGDRPVALNPPFWTVPLLSPPPMAVLMRPFALLPGDGGAYAWWAVCLVAIGGTIVALVHRRPIATAAAVIVLSIPLAYEIGVGNLNGVVLALLVSGWFLFARGREVASGIAFAAATALKVTPGIMMWWLVTQRRWSGVKGFLAASLVVAVVSVLGAGLSAHLEYPGIILQTSAVGSSDLSSAGIARFFGLPADVSAAVPIVLLASGFAAIWAARGRPGLAYAIAVVTMLAGSPVVNVNWFALLLAVIAPLAWPLATAEDASPEQRGAPAPAPVVHPEGRA